MPPQLCILRHYQPIYFWSGACRFTSLIITLTQCINKNLNTIFFCWYRWVSSRVLCVCMCRGCVRVHWIEMIVVTKLSLATLKVVKMTTFRAANDKYFIKMKTFPFQCMSFKIYHKTHCTDISVMLFLFTTHLPLLPPQPLILDPRR